MERTLETPMTEVDKINVIKEALKNEGQVTLQTLKDLFNVKTFWLYAEDKDGMKVPLVRVESGAVGKNTAHFVIPLEEFAPTTPETASKQIQAGIAAVQEGTVIEHD